ncbi:restriction endonuclease subunit S [Flavobacterium sp. LB3R33]|uniref:restriction endonuclease subunit S n=1 Tax=Flavobacterium sp. LB3R33 TaxID=3401721 RepID=UPI003AAECCC1
MKKYDGYKDSGIEWIGEIPEHWKIQRLKYAFDLGTGLSITKENLIEKGVPCVNYGEIHSKYGFEVDINKHNLKCVDVNYLNTSKKALMNQGEFIFADTSEDIEGSGNFTHIKSNGDIFAGYHTITARPIKKSNSLYFAFLFDSIDFRTQIRNSVKGIKVFSITQGILKDTCIWHPPFEEQTAIANYLDHKTTQIDTLIAKKQQFIILLQEERTAVINQAVTKGLDPKVKMKDSGIEWLGEIPEHWTSYRIDWVTNIVRGNTGFKKDELLKNGEYVALQYGKTYKVDIVDDSFNFFVNSEFFKENQVVSKGDTILISTSETVEDLGHTCFYNNGNIGLLGGEQILLKPNRKVLHEKYLYQYTRQFGLELKKYAKGLKVFRFNTTDLKQIFIAIPSIEEQIQIADFLDRETIRLDSLISKSKQEIGLLKEYKTALISEVVTGKIDVRDVVLN